LGATLSAVFTQHAPVYDAQGEKDLRPADAIPEPFRSIVRDCLRHNPNQRCTLDDIEARLQPPARSVAAVETTALTKHRGRGGLFRFAIVLVFALATIGVVRTCGRGASRTSTPELSVTAPSPASTPSVEAPEPGSSNSNKAGYGATPTNTAKSETVSNPTGESAPKPTQSAVARQVIPTVSPSARRTITGTVRINVRVDVDSSGKVLHAKLASPERSKYFANLALKASEQWEFSPSSVDGHSTSSVWILRYGFSRTSTHVTSEQLQR
jgi:TonB family protein